MWGDFRASIVEGIHGPGRMDAADADAVRIVAQHVAGPFLSRCQQRQCPRWDELGVLGLLAVHTRPRHLPRHCASCPQFTCRPDITSDAFRARAVVGVLHGLACLVALHPPPRQVTAQANRGRLPRVHRSPCITAPRQAPRALGSWGWQCSVLTGWPALNQLPVYLSGSLVNYQQANQADHLVPAFEPLR